MPPPASDNVPGVSVVVAARNEAERLPTLLRALASQKHPKWEVIVVDDYSSDGTADAARTAGLPSSRLRVVLNRYAPGKKGALRTGVEAAQYGIILFTDADCRPRSPRWIAAMAAPFLADPTPDIVVGPSLIRGKGALGRLQQYEHYWEIQQGIWVGRWIRPYLAVGRNWACRRSVWLRLRDIPAFWHTPWGDDDQAVLLLATPSTYRWHLGEDAVVETDASPTMARWLRQRQRHLRGGLRYPFAVWIVLALLNLLASGWLWALWAIPFPASAFAVGAWMTFAWATYQNARRYGMGSSQSLIGWTIGQAAYHALIAPLFHLAAAWPYRRRW